jgi:hypothetical protein
MGNNNTSRPGDPDHRSTPAAPSNTDYRHARWPSFPKPQPESLSTQHAARSTPRVVVVGVCSAGKSTLVSNLKEAGYDAHACSQEHSYVPHLWQLSEPDVLVYLDASLHTIRRRRRAKWHQNTLDEEHRRLAHAREHCDLYVSTDGLLPEDVASKVAGFLKMRAKDDGSNKLK